MKANDPADPRPVLVPHPPRPRAAADGVSAMLPPPPSSEVPAGGAGPHPHPAWPILAAAANGVQVGAAMVATRFVAGQIEPASLALLRYLIGAGCLVPLALLARQTRIARRDLAPIALLGIGQFGVLIDLLNLGLRTTPAGRAAMIFALFPLLTMPLAAALGRERLTAAKTAGVLLSLAGVGLALGASALAGAPDPGWLGEGAIFASALVGALCSVLYRPYLQRYPALPVSALAMVAAIAFLALLATGEDSFRELPPRLTPGGWGAVLFIGVGSGAGYVLWLWALGRASPTRVTLFLALSPVTAVLLGALLLGEALSPATLLGLVLVAAGLRLAHR